MKRLPSRYAPVLFGLFLSGFMSLVVSGIATLRGIGLSADFARIWLTSWLPSWAIAFPVVLIVAPLVRRVVAAMTLSRG